MNSIAGSELDALAKMIAKALEEVARNPKLAQWFAEEQAFDRAIAAHLEAVPPPFGLKTRILASATPPAESRQWSLAAKLAAVAALLFLLAQIISLFRASAPGASSTAMPTAPTRKGPSSASSMKRLLGNVRVCQRVW